MTNSHNNLFTKMDDVFVDLNNEIIFKISANLKFNPSLRNTLDNSFTYEEILKDKDLLETILVPNISITNNIDGTRYISILINREVIFNILFDNLIKHRWRDSCDPNYSKYEQYDIYFCELIHEILEKYNINSIAFVNIFFGKGQSQQAYYTFDKPTNKYVKII